MPNLRILPGDILYSVPENKNLLEFLREAGFCPDTPCGGNGTCGKCKVWVDGEETLACHMVVCRDMTVTVPESQPLQILHSGIAAPVAAKHAQNDYALAIDIGTTSLVCFLLDGHGRELAKSNMHNPQRIFGADVLSRIRAALAGELTRLTGLIRDGISALIRNVCTESGVAPQQIRLVSVVGNPAMQQLFLGISPKNLAAVPFSPMLREVKTVSCQEILPICPQAQLLIVPDISGYVGADTLGCVLSTELYQKDEITLLVDIGTNGEMVLGNKNRMVACAAAAGPALEGANIQFGMCAAPGAIDRVWLQDGKPVCTVIGSSEARGICGSGIVDAVAAGLRAGLLNSRGRIQNETHTLVLTDTVHLTQEDIRQVQLAKGAICAGILLMARQLQIEVRDIQRVLLAGAFGSHIDPKSACRIGLLPEVLRDRIVPVGNAAGSGAKMLALDPGLLSVSQQLCDRIEFLELASLPEFPKTFAKAMRFREEQL